MASQAPKMDNVSKLMLLLSAVAILAVVYVLISSLINTYQRNSLKGEVDNTQLVLNAENNIKPIGFAAEAGAVVANAAGRPPKEIYTGVCAACHATGVLEAPKFGDKAAWEARAGVGIAGLLKSATEGKGAMPAKGGDPSITDSELEAVILYMTKEAGLDLGGAEEAPKAAAAEEAPKAEVATEAAPATEVAEAKSEEKQEAATVTAEAPKVEAAPVAPTTPEAPKAEEAPAAVEAPAAPLAAAAPVVAAAPAKDVAPAKDNAEGKKVYDTACFACHASGVAGSPILGNKEQWAPRIAQGIAVLYKTAIAGKGAMPPKGGNMSLEDSAIKAAVDYMVSQSQ